MRCSLVLITRGYRIAFKINVIFENMENVFGGHKI